MKKLKQYIRTGNIITDSKTISEDEKCRQNFLHRKTEMNFSQ